MKLRTGAFLMLASCLIPVASQAQEADSASLPPVYRPLTYPKPFLDKPVLPSGPYRFLLSEPGRRLLREGTHPLSKALLRWMGEDTTGVPEFQPRAPVRSSFWPSASADSGQFDYFSESLSDASAEGLSGVRPNQIDSTCTAKTGNRFNLEPNTGDPTTGLLYPLPQTDESVDFLYNGVATGSDIVVMGATDYRGLYGGLGGSMSGFYARTTGGNCTVALEGGMPTVTDPNGDVLFGLGGPAVAADPLRNEVFYASPSQGAVDNAITVAQTTGTNLTNTTTCPTGTETSLDTPICWPTSATVNVQPATITVNDSPRIRVDEAATGSHTGASDVYIVSTQFSFAVQILLTACTNSLAMCSSSEVISGPDSNTQFGHVTVRQDGTLSITYINTVLYEGREAFDIKYVSCTPNGAPAPPTCQLPQHVVTETQPLPFAGFLATEAFPVVTHPKNDVQVETNGEFWVYIVWERCDVVGPASGTDCPDSEVYAVAANTGTSGSPIATPVWSHAFAIANATGNQFLPSIRVDTSRQILNITYYTVAGESFNHRVVQDLQQIDACAGTAPCPLSGSPSPITTTLDEPQGDGVFGLFPVGTGDYADVAARGNGTVGDSRAIPAFTGNNRVGTFITVSSPDEDNYVSRFNY
jgi:hypothetical protein